ncbi:unnamed protein product [Peniophora sp. CBMAI 1063]|nr:unnamed protein product [Peniophora sp. CBMAI 1063]
MAPALPSPVRDPSTIPGFELTTHILPAAYPRCSPDTPLPWASPPPNESREARKLRVTRMTKEVMDAKEMYERGCSEKANVGSEDVHWTVVNRYARRTTGGEKWTGRRGGVTLFCVHPLGQHKETYEPMLRHLLERAKYSLYHVEEIWSIDFAQHGDSGLLNASKMGVIYDHMDSVRDLANFFLHYLPEGGTETGSLPTHLARVTPNVTRRREEGGLRRRVVAVAHSQGAAYIPLVAYHYPGLISGMFMVDPVLYAPDADKTARRSAFTKNLISQRDRWPSREAAYDALKKSAWGAWDDEVLRVYVEHALTENHLGGVTLKCPAFLGAALHENLISREAWMAIPALEPSLPMHWVLPTPEESFIPESLVEGPWRRPRGAASSCSIVAGGGHLIVQTKPQEVARELHGFLNALYPSKHRARL